ncbi:LOW QUALITY PROTEIN: guanine nucleotide-binding protein subunit gamma 3 [Morus notabilis]|uniref:LOW QUALITY PROTEIN: guanine nucleotide-binding protein subunit gamma 3 n=1 Tax=Morus notabilis TaxID=981085 RepID=UPI000CED2C05|nr:LOW QUALITY PROTEIN: guanine nucleotide-binding protein subunit gamma 3 [Morus notabilis]
MAAAGAAPAGRSSNVPSLPPPCPKSPPAYPDLYGKRREMAKVQMLEREIGFLQEELKSAERIQPSSRCCKEITEFVVSNPDPLIPTNRKKRRSCRFWKWLCRIPCFNFSWICCCCSPGCCSCCAIHLEMPRCCDCNCSPCHCLKCCSCPSCFTCALPKWCCCRSSCCCCCCSCPRSNCCKNISCSRIAAFFPPVHALIALPANANANAHALVLHVYRLFDG